MAEHGLHGKKVKRKSRLTCSGASVAQWLSGSLVSVREVSRFGVLPLRQGSCWSRVQSPPEAPFSCPSLASVWRYPSVVRRGAGAGFRTRELLRDRILSPAPLTRLGCKVYREKPPPPSRAATDPWKGPRANVQLEQVGQLLKTASRYVALGRGRGELQKKP